MFSREMRKIGEPPSRKVNLQSLPFTQRQKEKAKSKHPLNGQVPLEVDHIDPYYRSRNDSDENAQAVTRPQHAIKHHELAVQSEEWVDARVNYWAVGQIVRRMTPKELAEFNEKLSSG